MSDTSPSDGIDRLRTVTIGHVAAKNGRTALYRLYGEDGGLLYVGITGNPVARFYRHGIEQPWWPKVAKPDVCWFDTRKEARAAEAEAVRSEQPLHNDLLQGGVHATVVSIKVSRAMLEQIEERARDLGVTRSEWARTALHEEACRVLALREQGAVP